MRGGIPRFLRRGRYVGDLVLDVAQLGAVDLPGMLARWAKEHDVVWVHRKIPTAVRTGERPKSDARQIGVEGPRQPFAQLERRIELDDGARNAVHDAQERSFDPLLLDDAERIVDDGQRAAEHFARHGFAAPGGS